MAVFLNFTYWFWPLVRILAWWRNLRIIIISNNIQICLLSRLKTTPVLKCWYYFPITFDFFRIRPSEVSKQNYNVFPLLWVNFNSVLRQDKYNNATKTFSNSCSFYVWQLLIPVDQRKMTLYNPPYFAIITLMSMNCTENKCFTNPFISTSHNRISYGL